MTNIESVSSPTRIPAKEVFNNRNWIHFRPNPAILIFNRHYLAKCDQDEFRMHQLCPMKRSIPVKNLWMCVNVHQCARICVKVGIHVRTALQLCNVKFLMHVNTDENVPICFNTFQTRDSCQDSFSTLHRKRTEIKETEIIIKKLKEHQESGQ